MFVISNQTSNKQGFEKHSRLGVISKAHSGFWYVPKNQIYSGIADSSQTRKGLSSRPVVPEQATGWKR